jgi:uncharacterized small protein (DUF1192 family)
MNDRKSRELEDTVKQQAETIRGLEERVSTMQARWDKLKAEARKKKAAGSTTLKTSNESMRAGADEAGVNARAMVNNDQQPPTTRPPEREDARPPFASTQS